MILLSSMGEKLANAGVNSLICIAVVFIVLIFISLVISLFGFTQWGIASNGVIALIVLSISTIYAIKKCTNDYTLAACTYLFFFSSFWIFLFIPDSVLGIAEFGVR